LELDLELGLQVLELDLQSGRRVSEGVLQQAIYKIS
jgi:hypothetical protein